MQPEMSDINLNTIILAIVAATGTLLTTLVTGIVAVILAKINKTATETKEAATLAASKVEDVKTALVNSDKKTDNKLTEIHTLVNSKFSTLLKTNAIALRRVASGRDANADDEAAAVYAETALAEHEEELKLVGDSLKVEIVKIPIAEKLK